ncbi:MAG: hypothetical protein GY832_03580 [Chloroflexi bacterium]|nr:hypothetical protein [Chloroflexota bacterium]
MTVDEEYTLISEMLQNNGNCRLPCWWGFTPGKTSPQVVKIFFASQGKKIWGHDDFQDYLIIFDIPAHYSHGQNYVVREGVIEMIGIGASPPVGEDGYFAYGDSKFIEDWKPYMLSQILEVYGRPQQVFLETYNHMLWIPFRLLLFYPDQGFLVKYEGDIGEEGRHHGPIESGEVIRICPWRSEIFLLLWPPEHEMTFDDLGPDIRNPVEGQDKWRSLEEATGMSIEQFYQTFVQPDNQTCLETPANIW